MVKVLSFSMYLLSGFILYYIYRYDIYIIYVSCVSTVDLFIPYFSSIWCYFILAKLAQHFSTLSRLLCRSWYIVFSTILVVFVVAVIIGQLLLILLLLPNIYFILVFFTHFGYVFDIRFPYLSNDFYLHIIFFFFISITLNFIRNTRSQMNYGTN